VRHDRVNDLRASNSHCSPEEWEGILTSLLVKNAPVDDVDVGAEVRSGKSITLTIRRRVAGINVSAQIAGT
jgi:hypothetical protein